MAKIGISCSDDAIHKIANDGIKNLVSDIESMLHKLRTFLERAIEKTDGGGGEEYKAKYTGREYKNPVDMARMLYQERRLRDSIFNLSLTFSEPAWDILLDLFVNGDGEKKISITSACIAANVPPTTGLRWLNELEGLGLLIRKEDMNDRRRSHISLSTKGNDLMIAFFDAQRNRLV